ncbi:MAG: prepilin-type N-terminal cleavage/methylation domain-containing protein [Acidimicrobiia bacterium]|nr:prepilin-type N-terminal cleavage/methylation domain-containing protein [Acidimicrobiia bacterium]
MEGPPSGGEGNSGTTPSRRCAEDGLTLIELAVAVTVFAVLVTGLAATMYSGLALTRNNRSRSVAANLASQEMDLVRSSDFTDLPLGLVSSTQDVDGIPYTVQRQSSWVPTGATTGACDSVGSDPAYLRVEVAVTWPNMQGVQPVRSDTLLTPPVGAYDPDSGHIAVKVRNREAAPLAAQPVTVTGPGLSRLLLTTTDGCAFFDHLPADTYTVALGTTGYVDRQGVAGPTQTAGVLAGATTSVGFDYDRSATLELTLTAPDGGTVPADLAVTLGNTQFLPDGRKTVPGSGNPPYGRGSLPVPRRLPGLGRRLRRRRSRGPARRRLRCLLARRPAGPGGLGRAGFGDRGLRRPARPRRDRDPLGPHPRGRGLRRGRPRPGHRLPRWRHGRGRDDRHLRPGAGGPPVRDVGHPGGR